MCSEEKWTYQIPMKTKAKMLGWFALPRTKHYLNIHHSQYIHISKTLKKYDMFQDVYHT